MERLTERRDAQWVIPLRRDGKQKWALCKAGMSLDDSTEYLYGDHANHLAAYEDAMPLERAQELSQAEKDGRLVVLPCKVGDSLYEVDLPEYGVIACKVLHIGTYNGPMAHVPGGPMVSAVSVGVEVVEGHGKGSSYAFETPDFGELVFLTREEAEAALKKEEGGTNAAN